MICNLINGMASNLFQFRHFCGIERECLRILSNGNISQQDYPKKLVSKLMNSSITVDCSDRLLEFITKPRRSIKVALKELIEISSFCLQNMHKDPIILNMSMPLLASEDKVRIADFGVSNSGKMKQIYRQGLALIYGKIMHIIAGVHYNFSFASELLSICSDKTGLNYNQLYFAVINKFV